MQRMPCCPRCGEPLLLEVAGATEERYRWNEDETRLERTKEDWQPVEGPSCSHCGHECEAFVALLCECG